MWQSVINYMRSLWSYRDLGPDIWLRRQINFRLRDRTRLSLEGWISLFLKVEEKSCSRRLLAFVYRQLPKYSGLEVGRIRPSDRLIEDLQMPLVCWYDWSHQLCDDFLMAFQVDISEEFDEALLETVGDLVWFLNQRLQSMDSVPSG